MKPIATLVPTALCHVSMPSNCSVTHHVLSSAGSHQATKSSEFTTAKRLHIAYHEYECHRILSVKITAEKQEIPH